MQDTQVVVKSKHLEQFQEEIHKQVPLVFNNPVLQILQAVEFNTEHNLMDNLKHLMNLHQEKPRMFHYFEILIIISCTSQGIRANVKFRGESEQN